MKHFGLWKDKHEIAAALGLTVYNAAILIQRKAIPRKHDAKLIEVASAAGFDLDPHELLAWHQSVETWKKAGRNGEAPALPLKLPEIVEAAE